MWLGVDYMAGSGRLTERQRNYAKLVAGGMDKKQAAIHVGYATTHINNTLAKLKESVKLQRLIEAYNDAPVSSGDIANADDRQRFWTSVMNDPSFPPGTRLEASKLLGKSQGDFIDRKHIETSEKLNPVVILPNTTPEEWEEQWENNVGKNFNE